MNFLLPHLIWFFFLFFLYIFNCSRANRGRQSLTIIITVQLPFVIAIYSLYCIIVTFSFSRIKWHFYVCVEASKCEERKKSWYEYVKSLELKPPRLLNLQFVDDILFVRDEWWRFLEFFHFWWYLCMQFI